MAVVVYVKREHPHHHHHPHQHHSAKRWGCCGRMDIGTRSQTYKKIIKQVCITTSNLTKTTLHFRTILDVDGHVDGCVLELKFKFKFTVLIIQTINTVIQLNGSFKEYIQTNECSTEV